MMEEKDFLAQIRAINNKVDIDTEFPDWKKSVQFKVNGENGDFAFYFVVDGKKISEAASGELPEADVIIEGSQKALSELFEGNLAMIGAFITQEVNIRGTVGDAVGANVLIQAARVF